MYLGWNIKHYSFFTNLTQQNINILTTLSRLPIIILNLFMHVIFFVFSIDKEQGTILLQWIIYLHSTVHRNNSLFVLCIQEYLGTIRNMVMNDLLPFSGVCHWRTAVRVVTYATPAVYQTGLRWTLSSRYKYLHAVVRQAKFKQAEVTTSTVLNISQTIWCPF